MQTAIESQELGHQLLQKQSAHKETTQRLLELDALRRRRDVIRQAIEDASRELLTEKEKTSKQKETLESERTRYQEETHGKLIAKRDEYRKMFELLVHAQTHARSKVAARETHVKPNGADAFAEFDNQKASQRFDADFGAVGGQDPFAEQHDSGAQIQMPQNNGPRAAIDFNTHDTYKCRALFAFEARSEDELSFEPGDVIIVFQSHAAEPGWKAGQLKEKVGWFPEAFVEAIAAVPQGTKEPPIQVSLFQKFPAYSIYLKIKKKILN